jgi:hypothetical protein
LVQLHNYSNQCRTIAPSTCLDTFELQTRIIIARCSSVRLGLSFTVKASIFDRMNHPASRPVIKMKPSK